MYSMHLPNTKWTTKYFDACNPLIIFQNDPVPLYIKKINLLIEFSTIAFESVSRKLKRLVNSKYTMYVSFYVPLVMEI
jgi:hypothetical protein